MKSSGGKHQKVAADTVANYKPNHMAEDYFMADPEPFEPDHNYPQPQQFATVVNLDGDDTLYIYVQRPEHMPPGRFQKELDITASKFKEALPNTTIIVGAHDLKFTSITKKQEFKSKLDGTL